MSKENTYIYALIDPRDGTTKYIGATSTGLRRYTQHTQSYYLVKSTRKNNWIKSLLSQNLLPELKILQYCEKNDLCKLEEHYIKSFKDTGVDLLNHNSCGYGTRGEVKSSEEKKRNASLKFTKHPIINLETKEIFECVYDVLKKYPDLVYTSLQSTLQKSHKSASVKGKFFSYYTEGLDIEKELKSKKERANWINNTGSGVKKKIKEITTDLIFNSIKEAAEYFKIHSTNISHHLAGRKKSTRGFKFEYVK